MDKDHKEKSEWKNEDISVILEKKPHCLAHLDISLNAVFLQKMYTNATKRIRKHVSLPGFRKGRVPDQLLEQKYPKEIEKDFLEITTDEALNQAVRLADLRVFNPKERVRVKLGAVEKNIGGKITAEFEIYPELPEIDLAEIQIKKITPEPVSEELIDQNIDFFRLRHAKLQEINGRPVQEGDVLDLEITRMDRETASKYPRIILSKEKTEKWIYENVIGVEKGSTIENIQPEFSEKRESEPYKVKITVHQILEGEVPEPNEELAKKIGYESIDQLREKIKKEIEQVISEETRKAHCLQIEQALIHKYHFDIPASVKNRQKNSRLDEKKKNLPDSEKNNHEKIHSLEHDADKEAGEVIRLQFIFSKLLGTQNITVSETEVTQQLLKFMTQNPGYAPTKEDLPQLTDYLREQALIQKLFDYLLSHVQMIEKSS